eukprot:5610755-Pleurochrysis_carterae.AAC.1
MKGEKGKKKVQKDAGILCGLAGIGIGKLASYICEQILAALPKNNLPPPPLGENDAIGWAKAKLLR